VFRAVNGTLALTQPFFGTTAPLRIALLHRHALIDSLLGASQARVVVELAAGLSRRGVSSYERSRLRPGHRLIHTMARSVWSAMTMERGTGPHRSAVGRSCREQ
jgi:hypothetical protein